MRRQFGTYLYFADHPSLLQAALAHTLLLTYLMADTTGFEQRASGITLVPIEEIIRMATSGLD